MLKVNNENPIEHWQFVEVENKIVLDLGCGRWEKVEKRDKNWLTTPEYFISKGASKVIAIDIDLAEISWFLHQNFDPNKYTFLQQNITSNDDIATLIDTYKPNCIKCDIETGERFLLDIDKKKFLSVEQFYIETHGDDLYQQFLNIFNKYNYTIVEQIDLTHTSGYCKVIFAKKQNT